MSHTPGPCGCSVVTYAYTNPLNGEAMRGDPVIVYCATHAQAPAMLAALQWIAVDPVLIGNSLQARKRWQETARQKARAILRAVDGNA